MRIRAIAKNEVLELYRDGLLRALALSIRVLAMLAFGLSLVSTLNARAEIDEARCISRSQWPCCSQPGACTDWGSSFGR